MTNTIINIILLLSLLIFGRIKNEIKIVRCLKYEILWTLFLSHFLLISDLLVCYCWTDLNVLEKASDRLVNEES